MFYATSETEGKVNSPLKSILAHQLLVTNRSEATALLLPSNSLLWERVAHSVDHMFPLYYVYCIKIIPAMLLRVEFRLCSYQFLVIAYFLLSCACRVMLEEF